MKGLLLLIRATCDECAPSNKAVRFHSPTVLFSDYMHKLQHRPIVCSSPEWPLLLFCDLGRLPGGICLLTHFCLNPIQKERAALATHFCPFAKFWPSLALLCKQLWVSRESFVASGLSLWPSKAPDLEWTNNQCGLKAWVNLKTN